MQKDINGIIYNTDTATKIGAHEHLEPSYARETLCRMHTGEYFLHGEDDAGMLDVPIIYADGKCGSEDILPMSQEDAMQWTEEHLDADTYIAEFGEVPE